ncbi:MAG: agmatine deiminase family protein, partial [Acidimicrobiia bacterium]
TIVDIALAIAEFEPVRLLARPEEVAPLRSELGEGIEVIEAPVDDLWARDTLPNFLVRTNDEGARELGASHARFNGWGGKQIHSGDALLAELVAANLGISLQPSTLVGEGGGIEVDGRGSVLAAASSWVNENRNPGMSRAQVEAHILSMLGADRMLWIDGLAGADITDGHIDTLARFASSEIIVIDKPAFEDPEDPWVQVAERTREQLTEARTVSGKPYELITMTQPENPRGSGDEFLATYMNFYVCNGAVIAPSFGDTSADDAARGFLAEHFHDREVVMIDIDPLAAGGGGIHCATQQQPSLST